jgi:hypothetical protein
MTFRSAGDPRARGPAAPSCGRPCRKVFDRSAVGVDGRARLTRPLSVRRTSQGNAGSARRQACSILGRFGSNGARLKGRDGDPGGKEAGETPAPRRRNGRWLAIPGERGSKVAANVARESVRGGRRQFRPRSRLHRLGLTGVALDLFAFDSDGLAGTPDGLRIRRTRSQAACRVRPDSDLAPNR